MAKQDRLYSAEEGAFMTRLTLASFRVKVHRLGIKGTAQGRKVFYTRKQLEDIHSGIPAKKKPGRKPSKKVAGRATKPKRVTKKPIKKVAKRRP